MVEQLDLSAIESVYEEEERGQPPYHPRMMTDLDLWYCVGVFVARIQKKLSEDIGFRVLAAGNQPDFRTISDFGSCIWRRCKGYLIRSVADRVGGGDDKASGAGGVGWSKVKANVSKHKAMSYGRMKEEEKR